MLVDARPMRSPEEGRVRGARTRRRNRGRERARRRYRRAAGLSLVEVLIAIAVLTVAMLGLLSAIFAAQANQRIAAARTAATNHARAVMEALLAYDERGDGPAVSLAEAWQSGLVQPILTLPDEHVEVLFFSPDDPGLPVAPTPLMPEDLHGRERPYYVEVTVTWRQDRRPMQVRLTRLVNPLPS